MKGDKNYFDLAGGSSYWGKNHSKFYEGNPREITILFETH